MTEWDYCSVCGEGGSSTIRHAYSLSGSATSPPCPSSLRLESMVTCSEGFPASAFCSASFLLLSMATCKGYMPRSGEEGLGIPNGHVEVYSSRAWLRPEEGGIGLGRGAGLRDISSLGEIVTKTVIEGQLEEQSKRSSALCEVWKKKGFSGARGLG